MCGFIMNEIPTTKQIDTERWYDTLAHITSREFSDSDEIKVLDFGGGDGVAYDEMNQRLAPLEYNLNWSIVEIPEVIQRYKNPKNKYPKWYLNVSDVEGEIDVAYTDGAIQSILDWKKTLEELCSKNPKWIFIHRLPAGDFETAKAKCYEERREFKYGISDDSETLEFWFFNYKDFVEQLSPLGYSVDDSYLYGYHHDWCLIENPKIGSGAGDSRTRVSLIFKKTN